MTTTALTTVPTLTRLYKNHLTAMKKAGVPFDSATAGWSSNLAEAAAARTYWNNLRLRRDPEAERARKKKYRKPVTTTEPVSLTDVRSVCKKPDQGELPDGVWTYPLSSKDPNSKVWVNFTRDPGKFERRYHPADLTLNKRGEWVPYTASSECLFENEAAARAAAIKAGHPDCKVKVGYIRPYSDGCANLAHPDIPVDAEVEYVDGVMAGRRMVRTKYDTAGNDFLVLDDKSTRHGFGADMRVLSLPASYLKTGKVQ